MANRVGGAVIGATVGFGVGLGLGYWASRHKPVDQREFAGVAEGLLLSAAAAPLAAHLFDRSRGALWPGVLLSTGVALVAYLTDAYPEMWAAPPFGIAVGIVVH